MIAIAVACVAITLIVGIIVTTLKFMKRNRHQRSASQEEQICSRSVMGYPADIPPPFSQAVAPEHGSNDDFFREYVPSWWNSRSPHPFLAANGSLASSAATLTHDHLPHDRPPSYEQVLRESDPNLLASINVVNMRPAGLESAADAPLTILPSETIALTNSHFRPDVVNDTIIITPTSPSESNDTTTTTTPTQTTPVPTQTGQDINQNDIIIPPTDPNKEP